MDSETSKEPNCSDITEESICIEIQESRNLFNKTAYSESQKKAKKVIKDLQKAFYCPFRATILPEALGLVICSIAKHSKEPEDPKDPKDPKGPVKALLHFTHLKAEFPQSGAYQNIQGDREVMAFLKSSQRSTSNPGEQSSQSSAQVDTSTGSASSTRVLKSLLRGEPPSFSPYNYDLLQPINHQTFIYDIEDNEENYYLKQGLVRNVHYAVEGETVEDPFPILRKKLDTDEDVMLVQTLVFGIVDWPMTIQAAGTQSASRLHERIQRYMRGEEFRLWKFCRMSVSDTFLSNLASASTLTFFHSGELLDNSENFVSSLELDSSSNALYVERQKDGKYYLTATLEDCTQMCSHCLELIALTVSCSRCGKNLFCSAACHTSGLQSHRQFCTSQRVFCFFVENRNKWMRPFVGIRNSASTCYAASCVQGLCSFAPLATEALGTAVAEARNSDNQSPANVQVTQRLVDLFSAIRAPGSAASIKPLFAALAKSVLVQEGLQDAHEFLLTLVNKVHEELRKPPIKKVDKEFEMCSWENFITNNESVISKSLFGLLETTTTCKYCNHESRSNQEFSVLSLPLSESRKLRSLQVRLFPRRSRPQFVSLEAELSMTAKELKSELGYHCPDPLLIAFQLGSELKFIPDDERLREYLLSEIELLAYAVTDPNRPLTIIYQYTQKKSVFFPRVFAVPSEMTLEELHAEVSQCISRSPSESGGHESQYFIVVCAKGAVTCDHSKKEGKSEPRKTGPCPHELAGRREAKLPYNDTRVVTYMREKGMKGALQLAVIWKMEIVKVRKDTVSPSEIIITQQSSSDIDLERSLDKFMQAEVLDSGNQWKCDRCLRSAPPQVETSILHCPRFLIIHIKRFASTHGVSRKLSDHVNFPDTNFFVKQKNGVSGIYRLCAVVVHKGEGLESGHYYAICRRGKEWVKLDDAKVEVKDWEWVQREEAYLLFYERVKTELAKDLS